ncbi:peroxidase-like [Aphis gossypii]|uniref:peroxidase-like n=1 Tax=Aphis gossypii TaxID=80765 RepID=UPI0021599982|nr:peroxidase-like [Aphis gossypii]
MEVTKYAVLLLSIAAAVIYTPASSADIINGRTRRQSFIDFLPWNSRIGTADSQVPSGTMVTGAQSVTLQNVADVCLTSIPCNPRARYRSFDGSCNNLQQPGWGSVNTALVRLLPAAYQDGESRPRLTSFGRVLPSARLIRTTLFPERNVPDIRFTLAVMQWAQVVAHDVTLLTEKSAPDCCASNGKLLPIETLHPNCFPIPVPANDHFYSRFGTACLPAKRTVSSDDFGCTLKPQQKVIATTHFLDASLVYGATGQTAGNLRSFRAGRMRAQITRDGRMFMPNVNTPTQSCNVATNTEVCYRSGDGRVNQHPDMAVSQVALLRLHNFLVTEFAQLNPQWNDEILYQEARKFVIAIIQHITYNEFLPILLGENYVRENGISPLKQGYSNLYNSNINPSTLASFAGGAFRSLHSLVPSVFNLVNEDRENGGAPTRFSEWMNKPGIIQRPGNYDMFLRGIATQPQQAQDIFFSEEITDLLFRANGPLGQDLVAKDIQRGRDMGIPSYNHFRTLCGLPKATSFDDIRDVMDEERIERLAKIYPTVDDIDYLVGGMLERIIPGTLTTPSFRCVLGEGFFRYKAGDRFFYEYDISPGAFSPDQLSVIRRFSLSTLICLTGDNIQTMQRNAFLQINPGNALIPCRQILTELDLAPWRFQS